MTSSAASSDNLNTEKLAAVNDRLLSGGQSFQTVQLADGSSVRTGTVAALLSNIEQYNTSSNEEERRRLEGEMELAVPLAMKIGLIGRLFTVDEWCAGSSNPGRVFVGQKARELAKRAV